MCDPVSGNPDHVGDRPDGVVQGGRRGVLAALVGGRGPGGAFLRGGLLPALQALTQARSAAPGAALQSLNFKNNAVEMKLSAPDATSLDHLSQALRSGGWRADLLGGTNTASGYEGRIQLSGSGG